MPFPTQVNPAETSVVPVPAPEPGALIALLAAAGPPAEIFRAVVFWQLCLALVALPFVCAVLARRALDRRTSTNTASAEPAGARRPDSAPPAEPPTEPPARPVQGRRAQTPYASPPPAPAAAAPLDPAVPAGPVPPDFPAPIPDPSPAGDGHDARQRRLDASRGRANTRAALQPLAGEGFYAFENLDTFDAGSIDQLLVGPNALHLVRVMPQRGFVGYSDKQRAYVIGTRKLDPSLSDQRSRWDFRPFDEDPWEVVDALARDVVAHALPEGVMLHALLCFTEADLKNSATGRPAEALTTVWDLAARLREADFSGRGARKLEPDEVDRLARKVAVAYGRPPWLVPEGRDRLARDLEERF